MTDARLAELLAAHALRALTATELAELRAAASQQPALQRDLVATDRVLAAFAAERRLLAAAMVPASPAEASSPEAVALGQAAARAEADWRARLQHGALVASLPPVEAASPVASLPTIGLTDSGRWRRRLGWALLAAALVVAAVGALHGAGAADQRPADLRAGARLQLVLLEPQLSAAARTLQWSAVAGAAGYDAVVVAADGTLALRRPAAAQASTAWELSDSEYGQLLAFGPWRLRVTALDGAGIPIGSSGDLALQVR